MAFNFALNLQSSCLDHEYKYYIYLKYILDSVSEFNGCHMIRRGHRNGCQLIFLLLGTELTFDILEFDKNCTQNAYFLQNVDFCVFEPKNCEVTETSSKHRLALAHYNAHT